MLRLIRSSIASAAATWAWRNRESIARTARGVVDRVRSGASRA